MRGVVQRGGGGEEEEEGAAEGNSAVPEGVGRCVSDLIRTSMLTHKHTHTLSK